MKATLVYPKPEIYQLDPSIVKFSTLQRERSAAAANSTTEIAAVPYSPKEHTQPQLRQAGTVVELSKHRPIAQHVGATYHQYPVDVVGDTLLRQQALLTRYISSTPPSLSSRRSKGNAPQRPARQRSRPSPTPQRNTPNPSSDRQVQSSSYRSTARLPST